MPIKVLDPRTIARIAAGEVVERPASVVKELIENSLDAGASQIAVEAQGGGVGLIRITDNGSGIPAGEVELAFERHATSKITGFGDLESIGTLGFRGEALASIVAVAEVELSTSAAGESSGSHLSLKEGKVEAKGSQGRAQGTTITVRNLFRSVPARLKFLKSTNTENSHIANVVSQYALAYPEVKFSLTLDGRNLVNTSGSGRLIDSIVEVYGAETARNMLEIKQNPDWTGSPSSITVTGMVGSPGISRASRDYLSFFVNRRWINNRLLNWAVEEAYHGLLMTGKHPVAVLNINLPARETDVNIHPTKSEIKFHDEHAVFTAVQKAVRRALVEQVAVPQIEEVATAYTGRKPAAQTLWSPPREIGHHPRMPLHAPVTPAFSLPVLRLLGQVAGNYIVAEGPDGLYLIDQHAAHERILFEQITEQHAQQKVEVQGLLEPATIEVSPQQEEVLQSHYTDLSQFGFLIEPFGNRTYLVRTVPLKLAGQGWQEALKELLDSSSGDKSDWSEKAAISIACHSAIRAGQVLNDDQMREMVRQLEKAKMPHTCPHGRPTMIHLSSGQLEREFGRT